MRTWFSRKLYLLALAVALPAASWATTVTYNFTSGSANVSATVGATTIDLNGQSSISVPLTGVSVTFDDMTPELVGFSFTLQNTGTVTLSPNVFGYTDVSLSNVSVAPGGGFDGTDVSFVSGPNPDVYNFTALDIDVTGTYDATSGSPPIPPNIFAQPFSVNSPSISGQITLNSLGEFQLNGITLGALPDPTDPNNPAAALIFKGDITFNGVPEPSTLLLVGLGLAGLTVMGRRRAR